jgi:hypothetical protein
LIRVVVAVAENAYKIPGLVVQRGSATLAEGQFGTPVPVDPGPVLIAATAPGHKRWEMTLDATREAATLTVQIPVLEELPAPEQGATAPDKVAPSPWPAQRVAGVGVMGGGIVTVGIAAVLGGLAIDKKSASEQDGHCDPQAVCDDAGLALRNYGRAMGDVSTGLFVAGGALLAGGVVLYLTAPKGQDKAPEKPSVAAFVGAGTLGVRGTW